MAPCYDHPARDLNHSQKSQIDPAISISSLINYGNYEFTDASHGNVSSFPPTDLSD